MKPYCPDLIVVFIRSDTEPNTWTNASENMIFPYEINKS